MQLNVDSLFTPLQLGGLHFKNRIVTAPFTRNRAIHGTDSPQSLNAEYDAQRASAGLIISEVTQISPTAKGYAWIPEGFIRANSRVTRVIDTVHAKDEVMYAQLWHVGHGSAKGYADYQYWKKS